MAYKAIVTRFGQGLSGNDIDYSTILVDSSNVLPPLITGNVLTIGTDLTTYTESEVLNAMETKIITDATGYGYNVTANDILYTSIVQSKSGLINISNSATKSFSSVSHSLNSAFQISTTRDCFVSYGVDIAATLSLTGGATGTITLQYADNSGMSTNLVTVNSAINANTGTLTLGLALTQTITAIVSGVIPAGKYVRIVTANTVGTPTFTYRTGQEVLS